MKAAICCLALVGIAFSAAQPAFAGQYGRRYQIVQTASVYEHGGAGKLVVLDRRTGHLWTWSEYDGPAYAGLLAANQPGSFARIISVGR